MGGRTCPSHGLHAYASTPREPRIHTRMHPMSLLQDAASVLIARGDRERAVGTLERCVAVSEAIGRPEVHDWEFDQLGRAYRKAGRIEVRPAINTG
jgi:hypothetical protein